jgi:hypothetical protein
MLHQHPLVNAIGNRDSIQYQLQVFLVMEDHITWDSPEDQTRQPDKH